MKIAVLVKQVPDTETKIKLLPHQSGQSNVGIDPSGVKWIINPYDEFALEAGIALRDKTFASAVDAFTVGPARAGEALRTALAMGCTGAFHVVAEAPLESADVAHALVAALKKTGPYDFILAGKVAIDDNAGAVFGMVASLLDYPYLGGVTHLDVASATGPVHVECEREGGSTYRYELSLPCVIAVDKGINTPRYASLPGIMRSKKISIPTYSLADLAVTLEGNPPDEDFTLPPERPAGKKVTGSPEELVTEIMRYLHEEAKIL